MSDFLIVNIPIIGIAAQGQGVLELKGEYLKCEPKGLPNLTSILQILLHPAKGGLIEQEGGPGEQLNIILLYQGEPLINLPITDALPGSHTRHTRTCSSAAIRSTFAGSCSCPSPRT